VGRLPVVSRERQTRVVGMISRSDLLSAHTRRLKATHSASRTPIITLLRNHGLAGTSKRTERTDAD
jgi:CBS domain containing-hemolysin-like protein